MKTLRLLKMVANRFGDDKLEEYYVSFSGLPFSSHEILAFNETAPMIVSGRYLLPLVPLDIV